MILDENLVVKISPISISHKGEKVTVDKLVFKHPTPMMAKDSFKMCKYFTQMKKETEKALMGNLSKEAAQEFIALAAQHEETLQPGGEVEALHKEYADGNEVSREDKLKEIAKLEKGIFTMVDSCDGVDFFAMTSDFGKMVLNNKRCLIQCNDDDGADDLEMLTQNIWNDQIFYTDRLKVAIKYCCFFDLTSNTLK